MKIQYTVKKPNGHILTETFTLEDIERGYYSTWILNNSVGVTCKIFQSKQTGFTDKKGVDIFEGSVLTPYSYEGLKIDKRFQCEVIFIKGMFCFAINKPFIDRYDPLYVSLNRGKKANNAYVVIGHIHQPEGE